MKITGKEKEIEFETVCGGKISEPAKYPSAIYKGKQVYFCTEACLKVFEKDPDKFISGEIEHPDD